MSRSPDTKTRFVRTGAEQKENTDKTLYLVFQKGGNGYGTSVSSEMDMTFARAELGEIKWCSYIGTDFDLKKCKPSQALKPGGKSKIE